MSPPDSAVYSAVQALLLLKEASVHGNDGLGDGRPYAASGGNKEAGGSVRVVDAGSAAEDMHVSTESTPSQDSPSAIRLPVNRPKEGSLFICL